MARATDIRSNVILPNMTELEGFGPVHVQRTQTSQRGGRPGTAYYLNEEQALLASSLSRTERAKEVRAMLIRVFVAYRRGQLVQAPQFRLPQTFAEALRLAADSEEARVAAESARQVAEQKAIEVQAESDAKSKRPPTPLRWGRG